MAVSAQQILDAFLERSGDGLSEKDEPDDLAEESALDARPALRVVTFGLRCSRSFGYVRIWGPSGNPARHSDCHIAVERYNGAVAVSTKIAPTVAHAELRPSDVHITANELGFSCVKGYGRFNHAVRPSVIAKNYATARELVDALIDSVEKAGVRW